MQKLPKAFVNLTFIGQLERAIICFYTLLSFGTKLQFHALNFICQSLVTNSTL